MIVRSIPSQTKKIFLTFDDGPDAVGTPRVLDILANKKAHATFFLVAEKLAAERKLVERIQREGHALGNHSLDHGYQNFFRSAERIKNWIEQGREKFTDVGALDLVGFRPPAGVITPKLIRALDELNEPLVLWTQRFFDSIIPWNPVCATWRAKYLPGGSIVLLHDRQSAQRISGFCSTLGNFIDLLRERGFTLAPLTRDLCGTRP